MNGSTCGMREDAVRYALGRDDGALAEAIDLDAGSCSEYEHGTVRMPEIPRREPDPHFNAEAYELHVLGKCAEQWPQCRYCRNVESVDQFGPRYEREQELYFEKPDMN